MNDSECVVAFDRQISCAFTAASFNDTDAHTLQYTCNGRVSALCLDDAVNVLSLTADESYYLLDGMFLFLLAMCAASVWAAPFLTSTSLIRVLSAICRIEVIQKTCPSMDHW